MNTISEYISFEISLIKVTWSGWMKNFEEDGNPHYSLLPHYDLTMGQPKAFTYKI